MAPESRGRFFLPVLFALFAILSGLSYIVEGASKFATLMEPYGLFTLLLQLALILFNLTFGVASIVIGSGLFLHKEWARKAWLVYVVFVLVVGIDLTLLQILAGYSGMNRVYAWIGMLTIVSAISWVYLSKPRTQSLFD